MITYTFFLVAINFASELPEIGRQQSCVMMILSSKYPSCKDVGFYECFIVSSRTHNSHCGSNKVKFADIVP